MATSRIAAPDKMMTTPNPMFQSLWQRLHAEGEDQGEEGAGDRGDRYPRSSLESHAPTAREQLETVPFTGENHQASSMG